MMSKLPPISEMDVDCECMEVSDDSARRDTIVDVGNSDISMSVSLMLAKMKKESLEKSKDDPVPFNGEPYKLTKKHPCMHLRELSDDVSYTYQDFSPDFQIGTSTCTAHVNGEEFTHNAATKKLARCYAATEALKQMFGYIWNPYADSDNEEATTKKCRKRKSEAKASNSRCSSLDGLSKVDTAEGDEDMPDKRTSDGGGMASGVGKRRRLGGSQAPKNALMHLHEMKPGIVFQMESQTGPVHAPVFTMSVTVNGEKYSGTGHNKKVAKQAAAESALRGSFVQFRNSSQAQQAMGGSQLTSQNFTEIADIGSMHHFSDFENSGPVGTGHPAASNGDALHRSASDCEVGVLDISSRNPIMALHGLRPGSKYELLSESGRGHDKVFTMSVVVDEERFEGCGRNKKMAKYHAAKAALVKAFSVKFPTPTGMEQVEGDEPITQTESELPDMVWRLVSEKFAELTRNHEAVGGLRKVLAGFTMTCNPELVPREVGEPAQVISLATGTKCISGGYLSSEGKSLNDCHAEVISRRSLLRFLYAELRKHLSPDPGVRLSSVFVPRDDGCGFRLRDGVGFRLFVSTAPCGDARLFSAHEPTVRSADKHPNRQSRGQLRTKIESGEGTVLSKSADTVQTWDGVVAGERLLTMSCSDKLLRWNVLGLQGSLLGQFVDPIYLDSVVLGSLYHPHHLSRALYDRLGPVDQINLRPPYRLNRPVLAGISNPEMRRSGKASNISINWCVGDLAFETVNTLKGCTDHNTTSRITKCSLFALYSSLAGRLPSLFPDDVLSDASARSLYAEAKAINVGYRQAREQLYEAFRECSLGVWMKKPPEIDQFTLDI